MLLMQIYYISSNVDIYLNVSTHESRNYDKSYGLQSSSVPVIFVLYLLQVRDQTKYESYWITGMHKLVYLFLFAHILLLYICDN